MNGRIAAGRRRGHDLSGRCGHHAGKAAPGAAGHGAGGGRAVHSRTGQPSRRPPGGGDGLPVPVRGGGAVRRAVAGECGVHHERYPRVEHRHPHAGEAGQPGGHLRLRAQFRGAAPGGHGGAGRQLHGGGLAAVPAGAGLSGHRAGHHAPDPLRYRHPCFQCVRLCAAAGGDRRPLPEKGASAGGRRLPVCGAAAPGRPGAVCRRVFVHAGA